MNIGTLMKLKRKEKGLTLCDVANAIGMTEALVSRIENGSRMPQAEYVNKLCDILDITEKEFNTILVSDKIISEHGDNPFILEALEKTMAIIKEKQ